VVIKDKDLLKDAKLMAEDIMAVFSVISGDDIMAGYSIV